MIKLWKNDFFNKIIKKKIIILAPMAEGETRAEAEVARRLLEMR